jgi:hypothetical protein
MPANGRWELTGHLKGSYDLLTSMYAAFAGVVIRYTHKVLVINLKEAIWEIQT